MDIPAVPPSLSAGVAFHSMVLVIGLLVLVQTIVGVAWFSRVQLVTDTWFVLGLIAKQSQARLPVT